MGGEASNGMDGAVVGGMKPLIGSGDHDDVLVWSNDADQFIQAATGFGLATLEDVNAGGGIECIVGIGQCVGGGQAVMSAVVAGPMGCGVGGVVDSEGG